MDQIQVISVERQERGKFRIGFENGTYLLLYRGEIRKLSKKDSQDLMEEGACIPETLYQKLLYEIVGVRARKRAVHLLEQMDRTEKQLSEKLAQNGYPKECIETAIAFLKQHHYLDDERYAQNYIRCRQSKKSRQRLKADLTAKGIARDAIDNAFEEEYEADESAQIRQLLDKRNFRYGSSDRKEILRTYQFLMRRGFRSSDILREMQADIFLYEA